MVFNAVKQNIITGFVPQEENRDIIRYSKDKKEAHIAALLEIKEVLSRNPFVKEQNVTIDGLIAMLQEIYRCSEMEAMVYKEIKDASDNYATQLRTESQEDQTKTQEFNYLLESAKQYIYLNRKFMKHLRVCLNLNRF